MTPAVEVRITLNEIAARVDGYSVEDYIVRRLKDAGVPFTQNDTHWIVARGEMWRTDEINGDYTFRWREQ